ncbi:MAG: hypothetical protein AAF581_08525 [Planctomycetota bacterium]
MRRIFCSWFMAAVLTGGLASAQIVDPVPHYEVPLAIDSGWVTSQSTTRGVIYSTYVDVPGAAWLQLRFDDVVLGQCPQGGRPTELRITSLLDGAEQRMQAHHVRQWQKSTAYFNGDSLLVELVADPCATESRLDFEVAIRDGYSFNPTNSICFATDDRLPSTDERVARVLPVTCTVWLISDVNHCFLTAGHCAPPSSMNVVEFNTPLSSSTGAIQHPPPEDQYAVDDSSIQRGANGIGADWGYFGCFPNTNTGLTPFQAQGRSFDLIPPPPVSGQLIQITGYGSTGSTVPAPYDNAQKSHEGPYLQAGNNVRYQTDTTGGNSGSPVILNGTNFAIGIHTHAGCNSSGGGNNGTGSQFGPLQTALANPLGVCVPVAPFSISVVGGLPDVVDPAGVTLSLTTAGTTPATGTMRMWLDSGSGFFSSFLVTETSPTTFDATIPTHLCGSILRYYFSGETASGQVIYEPSAGPFAAQVALVGTSLTGVFDDDFETDQGWTVTGNATTGSWERGLPIGGGDLGDPATDADGSGQCFVTGNTDGDFDVDGGETILTSPMLSTTNDSVLSYYRWFNNGASPEDELRVEVTADGGGQWTVIDAVVPPTIEAFGQWYLRSIRLSQHIAPTTQFQVRFVVSDTATEHVVEAAVDGVRLDDVPCGVGPNFLRGDVNDDGAVNIGDPVALLGFLFSSQAIPCELAADANDDEGVNVADAVFELSVLFGASGEQLPPPVVACGQDPTLGALPCGTLMQCP